MVRWSVSARYGPRFEGVAYACQVVIAVSNRMILQHELTRQRRIGVERYRRGPIELLVAERANRGRRGRAVATQQRERLILRHAVELLRVNGVQVMDHVPG